VQKRATVQSKTGIFRDCGVAKAPPGFQAGEDSHTDVPLNSEMALFRNNCRGGLLLVHKIVLQRYVSTAPAGAN
jgi:hypothetical protein